MDNLYLDFRLTLRRLASRPLFTTVVLVTLALGIGAITAIFSLVHGVLLEPLGLRHESRLVALIALEGNAVRGSEDADATESDGASGAKGRRRLAEAPGHSASDIWHFRRHAKSFDSVILWAGQSVTLEEPGRARQLRGELVSWDIFEILGLEPMTGRAFAIDDEIPGTGNVVMLSHAAWQRVWGGDRAIVGQAIVLDGLPRTVVGVMAPGVEFPYPGIDLWIPAGEHEAPEGRYSQQERDFHALGLLAEGVDRQVAEQELQALAAQLRAQQPMTHDDWDVGLVPLRERFVGEVRGALWVTFAAVGLVLLIACTNVANLVLVRALGRRKEMAIRAALGASRWRLVQQQLIDGLTLGLAGGGAGLLLAVWLQDLLLTLEPGILPRRADIDLEWPVLAFAAAIAIGTGLFFGLLPTLGQALDANRLRHGSRSVGLGGAQNRLRQVLVAGEIALALVLLAGALLLGTALQELQRTDLGFEPEGVLASHIILDPTGYLPVETRRRYFARVVESLRSMPGIEAAGATTTTPVPGFGIQIEVPYSVAGGIAVTQPGAPQAALRVITPGYLETVGIELLEGRNFDARDRASSEPVVLVNRTLARRIRQEGREALGETLTVFFDAEMPAKVVGVVEDTRFAGIDQAPRPAVFFVHPQLPFMGMSLVARTAMGKAAFTQTLEKVVLAVDASQPPGTVYSVEEELAQLLGNERFVGFLLTAFSATAVLLAAVGLYGIFSYWVSERVREIGVRMALGASAGYMQRWVLGRALGLTLVGLVPGLVGALGLASILRATFQGVGVLSPILLLGLAAVLISVALLATWRPALRASRIAPLEALRWE